MRNEFEGFIEDIRIGNRVRDERWVSFLEQAYTCFSSGPRYLLLDLRISGNL